MATLTAGTAARAYLIALLMLTFLLGSPVQLGVAVALLTIQLYSAYKTLIPSLNFILTLASLLLAPIALQALVGVYAFLLVIPMLPLLDEGLKALAAVQVLSFHQTGRWASDVLKFLFSSLLLVLGVSVIAWNVTLILTVIVLLSFVGILVAMNLHYVPKVSLVETKSWSRTVTGERETEKFSITNQAKKQLIVKIKPIDSWAHIDQTSLKFQPKENIETTVWFTPPLAGPSKIQLTSTYTDSRGLVETAQLIEPLNLHIIPRAKYAKWLANKYLEQTTTGKGMTGAQRSNQTISKQGLDYHSNRPYQTGDALKDIDWKHTYMLGELIVKQYSGSQGNVGIILADLTAKDVEDADVLAYNLVMSALTLATEGLPSALAVYNQKDVLAITQSMDSRETLKEAIELTEKISITEVKDKVLQPLEVQRIKRSIDTLGKSNFGYAQNLSQLLMTEIKAHQEASKIHPATIALNRAIKNVNGPAVLTVVSAPSTDLDPLSFELERLKEKGYKAIFVGNRGKRLQ